MYACRLVYWAQSGGISCSELDGSNHRVLFDDVSLPSGVSIDLLRHQLFWSDTGKETVEYSTLDGSDRHMLLSGQKPFQLDLFGDFLIWTSEGESEFFLVDMFNTDQVISLSVLTTSAEVLPLYGLAVVSESKRPNEGMYVNICLYSVEFY